MAIQSGDTILVQRGSTSYKTNAITYSDTAQASDLLLVNRGSNSYKMRYDAVDNASDSDLVLVNRGSNSYKATMAQLRDVLGQPITFTVQLGGPGFSGTDAGCSSSQVKRCSGATISASVTAKTTDIYSFAGDGTTLFINGDWIVTAGHAGSLGVTYSFGCNAIVVGGNGLGLSAVGNNTLEGQKPNEYISYSPYFQVLNGGGGAGCPGGATGANSGGGGGGYCQTRPRGENSGSTWNEITVSNVSVNPGSNNTQYWRMSYGGTTKSMSYNSTGKLKELLSW